jgi:hypothetical protein
MTFVEVPVRYAVKILFYCIKKYSLNHSGKNLFTSSLDLDPSPELDPDPSPELDPDPYSSKRLDPDPKQCSEQSILFVDETSYWTRPTVCYLRTS